MQLHNFWDSSTNSFVFYSIEKLRNLEIFCIFEKHFQTNISFVLFSWNIILRIYMWFFLKNINKISARRIQCLNFVHLWIFLKYWIIHVLVFVTVCFINENKIVFQHWVAQTLFKLKCQLKLNWHLKLFEMFMELIYT